MPLNDYCESPYRYVRRKSREVMIGNVGVGGQNSIRIQSMLTADTRDTTACVKEALQLAEAGCEIIRLTAQTKTIASNLQFIARELRTAGCHVPLVADIHFKPDAALEAAKWVEKIRVNPGNFVDKKKGVVKEYTDDEYDEEVDRLYSAFAPLVRFCKEHGRAMRIGANHGSLSDRILNRFGDTPQGMVESALEFARIARDLNYHELVFSMKASNVKVMVAAYRLLVKRLHELGADWNYPIHLGVTEAGAGEDGQIKSAAGIGALLLDGIGDTLRVSLTGNAVQEIPVAYRLAAPYQREQKRDVAVHVKVQDALSYNPYQFTKRSGEQIERAGLSLGGSAPIRVVLPDLVFKETDMSLSPVPELAWSQLKAIELDPLEDNVLASLPESTTPVTVKNGVDLDLVQAFRLLAAKLPSRYPIVLKDSLQLGPESNELAASTNIGTLLIDGIGDAILIRSEHNSYDATRLAYNILQAVGARLTRADYVSCPSCGRTLYDIQAATERIRKATEHLQGIRIAVMGCIVNGPGEMADADFGYVGGAPNKINLYVKQTPVQFNIPQEEAVDRLIDLIKEHGCWVDPQT